VTDLVIVGAGGHGREVHDIALAAADDGHAGCSIVGFVDDNPVPETVAAVERRGVPVLGPVAQLALLPSSVQVLIGVGSATVRARLADHPDVRGRGAPVLVHPSATVGTLAELGPGTVVWPGARVSTAVRTGRHVHVNQNATVGHDAVLEDFATLHPAAAVSGSVLLGRAATMGANSFIRQGLRLGETSFAGAGSVVVRNVPDGVTVVGVPATDAVTCTPARISDRQ
jgi:sugar O-acyltransferase (sialic acid O-acetyltransferase NeuD family)